MPRGKGIYKSGETVGDHLKQLDMVRLHSAQRQGYKSGETVGDHLKQLDMVRLHSAQMQGFLLVSLIKIKIIYINLVGDHIYI